jgi:mRNA-degrading endonuclease RelE of RelBE toxin-antitoxin system
MRYRVAIARSAREQFADPDARWRSTVTQAMREHLETDPRTESKSRIKHLRGFRQPQYRLRVGEVRVYYDVNDKQRRIEVLGILLKPQTADWLREHGVPQ